MTCFFRSLPLLLNLLSSTDAFFVSKQSDVIAGRRLLQNAEVVCVGDALFDCIAEERAMGWTVEAMVEAGAWKAWPGGAPANVAAALCKLGTPAAFAGCVGSDGDGDVLQAILEESGVDTSLLRRTDAAPTRRVMVTRSKDGDREFAGFANGFSPDSYADCFLDASTWRNFDDALADTKWVVCSTLSLAYQQSGDAVYFIVEKALENGARLYVDVNWRPMFWPAGSDTAARGEILRLANRAHVVKLTDEEAEWLLDIPAAEALANPKLVHAEFSNALAVLVTAGDKGAAFSMLGQEGIVPPFKVDVTETTGAGDSFTAGFLHGLLAMDIDFEMFNVLVPKDQRPLLVGMLLRFAAAVGALTCTAEGAIAAQPTYAEVEEFLSGGV